MSTTLAPTLDGRLLCAAVTTYSIANGALDPAAAAPYFAGAGWNGTPRVIVGGKEQINACLVGEAFDGVVLAFRGTLPPSLHDVASLIDWMHDFDAIPAAMSGLPGTIKVHTGFWNDLMTIWKDVVAAVQSLTTAGKPLYITGHSKGGALASLSGLNLAGAFLCPKPITVTAVHTFASPRTGDTAFATLYGSLVTDAVRWEYQDDIVPHLPPAPLFVDTMSKLPMMTERVQRWTAWDYASVGTLKFIDWSDRVGGDSPALEADRLVHLARLIVEGRFLQIANDHDSHCGGGYMTTVCPTNVCPTATPELMASLLASLPRLAAAGAGALRGLP
jgi:hypothetical protein